MARIEIVFCFIAATVAFCAFGEPGQGQDKTHDSTQDSPGANPPSGLVPKFNLGTRPHPGQPAVERRSAAGLSIPPFGCSLDPADRGRSFWFEGFNAPYLAKWPEPSKAPAAPNPLAYDQWSAPYRSPAGERWVAQINAWYREGTAAGLTQDTFRSFDNGHSGIRLTCCPQMNSEKAVTSFGPSCEYIFPPRVTMGVQSYGSEAMSVIESVSRKFLRSFYETKPATPAFQRFHRIFYENNFLFVAPAVYSYSAKADAFSFLSPFYLHSVGTSGTDSKLLKPLVYASAALPPALKTRILRNGLFVPTLMYLFKSHIAGDIKAPAAHVPSYTLPEEASDDFQGPTPFLDSLLNSAHDLRHIPPVCRLRIESVSVEIEGSHGYASDAYHEENTYAFTGALREGQAFVLNVDLRYSWTDANLPITAYYAAILRGQATIECLNEEKSILKITIPWIPMDKESNFRSDVLLLVHDGTYYSAPAYISVRLFHKLDPIILGIKAH